MDGFGGYGHQNAPVVAAELEAALRAAGEPERAEGERRYLKSELEHFGVRVPEVRRLARGAAGEVGTRRQLDALADELWARPVHECRLCAAMVLAARPDLVAPADLPRLRRMVREARTWAIVDLLAVKVLGALLLAHPEAGERLDGWARDRDFWVRRAALLSQIEPLKAGAPFDRFAAYAEAMLAEREFFIRKAIGWVLREAGQDPARRGLRVAGAAGRPRLRGDDARGGQVPAAGPARGADGALRGGAVAGLRAQ